MKESDKKINQAVSWLKKSDVSGYSIEKVTGITQASISNWRNEKAKPTLANASTLIQYFENYIVSLYQECFALLGNIYNEKLAKPPKIRIEGVNEPRFEKLKTNINILLDLVDCEQKLPGNYSAHETELEYLINDDLTFLRGAIPKKTNITEERLLDKKALGLKEKAERKINGELLKNIPPDMIPLLPISAQAGSLNDFIVSIKDKNCERIISPIRGIDFAITVSGDSMLPEYPNGSYVLIKKINEKAFIEWGRVYVLDTCNGVVVKRIFPSEKEEHVKCVSTNTGYPSFDVEFNDIYGIYRVMLCMSTK
ncbi:MAG: S24 family peptidase [Tannerellaceae bacterium]|jgi:phage repressor protein C with HTH and peptisase S24 domain|nr:S24 family peptidase [Tannerellaceae bacterium]